MADGTDWLLRETWHSYVSGNVFDLVRYQYTNGRPSRVELVMSAPSDLATAWSYGTYYIQIQLARRRGDVCRAGWKLWRLCAGDV